MPLAGTRRHNALSDPHTYEKPHLRSSNPNFFSPTIGMRFRMMSPWCTIITVYMSIWMCIYCHCMFCLSMQ